MSFVLKSLTVRFSSHQSTNWSDPPIKYIISSFRSNLKINLFTNLPFTNFTSLSNITNAGAELMKDSPPRKFCERSKLCRWPQVSSFKFAKTLKLASRFVIWGHFCDIMELLLNNYLGIGTFYLSENFCVSLTYQMQPMELVAT